MEVCGYNHDEIVHEERKCPVCVMQDDHDEELKERDSTIEELQEKIAELEDEIESLKSETKD